MYVCMYVCMYACMYVCMYVCMYLCMHVMYVCMYVYMYVSMYVCIYVSVVQECMRTLCHVIINASCGGDVEDLPLRTDAVAVAEMWRRCLVTTPPRTGKSRVTKSRLQWTHRVRCCYLE